MSLSPDFTTVSGWTCLGIPASYAVGGLVSWLSFREPRRAWRLASGVSLAALALGVLHAALSWQTAGVADPLSRLLGQGGSSSPVLSLRLDALTTVMLLLITFVGWIVVRFSERYLDGDPRQLTYLRNLLFTLAAVSGLVSSNHLLVIALLWIATSLSLHGLLTHFAERPAAQIAAHKKFLLSRLADTCLLGAAGCVVSTLHTLELGRIFELTAREPLLPPELAAACVLLAISVLLKCAQLPFHGWLIQVMEAPTPVSALLHAGVVNIGGFLLIRLAPLMAKAPAAQALLLAAGLITASVASLVMLTRVSIKVMLAWSTCAQMGMMLVECALGAYDVALLHLVAHSLYKAHAFLGAGSAVANERSQAMAPTTEPLGFGALLGAGAVCLGLVVAAVGASGLSNLNQPAYWLSAASLSVALPSLLLRLPKSSVPRLSGRLLALTFAVVVAFAAAHAMFERILPGAADEPSSRVAAAIAALAMVLLFVVHAWLRQRPESPFARWLYPRAFAGFYLDELFTRLTFRVWPAKLPTAESHRPIVNQPQASTTP